MIDGQYTFFTIQHRKTHESPWLKPDGPLKEVENKDDFHLSSFDYFGHVFDPTTSSGNERKHKCVAAHAERVHVRNATGFDGYWTLKYAIGALRRALKGSDEGKFDSEHQGKKTQACRYDFRIVKYTVSQKVEVVDMKDVLLAVGD